MAARYVWSGAAGTGTGASWANAHVSLSAAITAASAGDTYYVANDHAANYGANTTLSFKGTSTAPDRILCVNRAGSVPPVAADLTTGAVEGTNAASASLTLGANGSGSVYLYGMKFAPGSGQSTNCSLNIAQNGCYLRFESCRLALLSSDVNSRIILSISASSICLTDYLNCQLSFGNTSQRVYTTGGMVRWIGPAGASILDAGSQVPGTLFQQANSGAVWEVADADLSAVTNTIIFGVLQHVRFVNCKLAVGVTINNPAVVYGRAADVIGCNSSGDVERNERYHYAGTLTTETTIKRTAGASDGTTAYSWKIASTANSKQDFPFETFEGALWNTATGSSKTLTFHCVTDNVTLTNADIWVEVEYLGSSGSPIAILVSSAPANVLTASSNLTSDSGEAWTTTGLTTPSKQKFSVSFTPQMVGPIRWRVKVAKASTTVYVDPNPDLT